MSNLEQHVIENLDYASLPEPGLPERDRRHLRFIEIAHRVLGWTTLALFGLPFVLTMCLLPMHGMADEPGESGLNMMLSFLMFLLIPVAAGMLILHSARWIARRTRRRSSITCAAVYGCLAVFLLAWVALYVARSPSPRPGPILIRLLAIPMIPLSVFTVAVLSRRDVKAVYEMRAGDNSNY